MIDLEPPHDYKAEVALLGSMILDSREVAEVLTIVPRCSDFYDETHVTIFNAILHVIDKLNPAALDLVMVQTRLKALGVYDKIGGDDKLIQLANSVPSAAAAPHYARIVAEKAKLRRLIAVSERAKHAAYHVGGTGHDTAQEVIDELEAAVAGICEEVGASEPQMLSRTVETEMARIEKADSTTLSGVPTGYGALDGILQGAQPGEVIIIAARPSMGKTALALNLSENFAQNGFPVALFSLEMSKSSVTQRLLSARSGVNSTQLRQGVVGGLAMTHLAHAAGELSETPILIDDSSSLTIMDLRQRARKAHRQHGAKVIVIDYLQLLTAPGARDGRTNEVAVISRGIKALARELNLPVVVLSQLNRMSENREGNRPRMADLRESGAIEQDADVILLLHREAYYHIQDRQWQDQNADKLDLAEVIIAKNRNGPTGTVELTWKSDITRFCNRSTY